MSLYECISVCVHKRKTGNKNKQKTLKLLWSFYSIISAIILSSSCILLHVCLFFIVIGGGQEGVYVFSSRINEMSGKGHIQLWGSLKHSPRRYEGELTTAVRNN